MSRVTVYGASDDLIEIEGDLSDEFDSDGRRRFLAFSDGTVLAIVYTEDGFWRVNRAHAGTAAYERHEATDADDDYSDRVTLDGDLTWVVLGTRFVRAKR